MFLCLLWLGVYCLGEWIASYADPGLAAAIHTGAAVLAFAIIFFGWASKEEPALAGISLLALQRVFSLTLPTDRMPEFVWYSVVGLPVLASVLIANHAYLDGWLPRRLPGKLSWMGNLALGLIGIPFALGFFALYRPPPSELSTGLATTLNGLAIILFAGILQELLFRGLVQTALTPLFGKISILLASIAFAASTLGVYSMPFSLAAFAMSLIFGYVYYRYRALAGLMLAHGLFAFLYLLVLPALLI
ncbi:MAG TPA: CPBP family intramembrane glutamic endopeptidase [Spirillospora sp.]|nr:CPBP family intramembrane glutamic endopeptidase [Spirillospora sp.]